jgi:predicted MFS family arabinose efflux permease
VLLAVFVGHQVRKTRRGGSPLVPMKLFTNRPFAAGTITQFCFMGAMTGFFLVLTVYLQVGLRFTAIGAGLAVLPFSVGAFVGSALGVPLAGKIGKPMVFLGAALQSGAVLWAREVVSAQADGLSDWELLAPLALAGLGLGLFVIPLVDLTLATVDVRDAGAGSGVFNTFQQVGAALGVAVAGEVFFRSAGTDFSAANLRGALLVASEVAVAGYALAALGSLLLPPSRLGAAHAAAEPAGDAELASVR